MRSQIVRQTDARFSLQETDPAVYPVTLGQAKDHLRLTDIGGPHEHNGMIADLIMAATEEAEAYTGRALVQRTFTYRLPCFFDEIELPRAPLDSVTSIQYQDTDNATQTLATSVYGAETNTTPGYVYLLDGQSWPSIYDSPNAVIIAFVGGYALDGTDYRAKIPRNLKQAILMMVEDMYEFTGSKVAGAGNVVSENKTVSRILDKHRVWY